MNILIIMPGRYPVPPVKGGAISTLVNHFIEDNDKLKLIDLYIISPYDKDAENESKEKKNCKFFFIKTPKLIKNIDKILYCIVSHMFKKKNCIEFRNSFSFVWYIFKTALILKKGDFDYVVIENTARLFWCLKLFNNKKKYQGRYYYHLHNIPKKFWGCKKVIYDCQSIFCVSNFVKERILSKNDTFEFPHKNRVKVLYNCIDTSLFIHQKIDVINKYKREWNLDNNKVIAFAGRLDAEKGVLELVRAFKLLNFENVRLLIAGSSFYGMEIQTEFEKILHNEILEIKDKVVFTGFLPVEMMPVVYSCADIVVLPSVWDEPAGLTVIEAMACEVLVITTISGGIPEYTNKECTIMLEKNENLVENIAFSIKNAFEKTELVECLKVKSRNYVIERFDSNKYLKNFYDLLVKEYT